MIWVLFALTLLAGGWLVRAYGRQKTLTVKTIRQLSALKDEVETLREEKEQLVIAGRITHTRHHRLETALCSIPDPLLVTDATGRLVLANAPAEKLFDFTLPSGSPKPLEECIQDRDFLELLLSARQAASPRQAEFAHAGDGKQEWYDVLISRVTDQRSEDIAAGGSRETARGLVALLRDVTREKEAAKMKTEFVANAAHELRTPLGGIKAYLEMLADGEVVDNATREKFYRVMQEEVNRLSSLIENILNISRIEAGIVKISREPVPLTVLVKEVLDVVRPKAEGDGYVVREELVPVFFHVLADREMIKQAVLNLLSNALKYTPSGGTVAVRMAVDEVAGRVTTEVIDTGAGISEEDLPKMFNKFFRCANTKTMAKGTGLGLVLVKEIIETVHGGTISVRSALGQGSTFAFTLPLVETK